MHKDLKKKVTTYIQQLQAAGQKVEFQIKPLSPDGSDRLYYRITGLGIPSFIAVDATGCRARDSNSGLSQNNTFRIIQQHLEKMNFPVPAYLAADSANDDLYLLQDLGDVTLHSFIQKHGWHHQSIALYQKVISLLLGLQVEAARDFKPQWAYAGGFYNHELIVERELNYFLQAFVVDFCRIDPGLKERLELAKEFEMLATMALRMPADFFLYRDFQSKNLMLHQDKIFLIDFQGARLGPCYYDLAALINDPYIEMPLPQRRELKEFYFHRLKTYPALNPPDAATFDLNFSLFSLIRTLQTLGAFGYLCGRGKKHFISYIRPALTNLYLYLNQLQDAGLKLRTLRSISNQIELCREEKCRQ